MTKLQQLKKMLTPRSLVWRLFGSIAACIAVLLIVILLLNTFALKPYYIQEKQDTITETFVSVNGVCRSTQALEQRLEYLKDNTTLSVIIWANRQILYSTQNQEAFSLPAELELQRGEYLFSRRRMDEPFSFITLFGKLDNDCYIMLRTPVAAIEESIGITNRFLLTCGGVTLLLALGLAFLLARSFTVPIRRLSKVAENVARLDFSDPPPTEGKDELSALGRSIHTMSGALESTITDLKNANLQLQSDVEQKTKQTEAHRAFIRNVSHELKTPIALISTYAEGLREDITGNREDYCAVIEDEAQKMSELIRRMTLLMQLEAGSEQLTVERFDISELLINLMNRLKAQFPDSTATLLPPAPVPTLVWADSFLMENVLTNFLTNAFHHVSANGLIEGHIAPAAGGRVRISVLNTGKHIPDADLPKIWDSFYKVDKARTRAYGGSGIGLSVVAAIMKAHRMPFGVRNRTAPNGDTAVEFYVELETK